MADLSIFIDESGGDDLVNRHYLLTLVLHDQSEDITEGIARYEASLAQRGLPDIPLHASPLMNGHDDYHGMSAADRARLLYAFRVFFRHLPIRYKTFVFDTSRYAGVTEVSDAMRRELVNFLFDNLALVQSFGAVKIYYDGGQSSITTALHKAIDYVVARNAVAYRPSTPADYRLAQAADYICTVELTELKYESGRATATDEKFFGGHGKFRKGVLKEVRRKLL
jgi:hypothetical protein